MRLLKLLQRKDTPQESLQKTEELIRRNREAEQRLRMLEANAQVFRRANVRSSL